MRMQTVAFLILATVVGSEHFRVATVYSEPYYFNMTQTSGEPKKSGYIVDLLEKLSVNLNFTYDIYESPDNKYGKPVFDGNGNVSWVGVIGQVVDGQADIAATDLTITPLRSEVVTFTVPFFRADLAVIYGEREDTFTWWIFLSPFTWQVWALIGSALLITSLILYFVELRDTDGTALNSIGGCISFSLACLFAQGPEAYPQSVTTRIVAASWWFLSLMLLVLYSADLTSTLTIRKGELAIDKLEDLLTVPDITFAIRKDTSIEETFKYTEYVPFQLMWQRMISFPEETLITDVYAAIQKVRDDPSFVFIGETPKLEYEIGKPPCNLKMITSVNGPKTGGDFGLAFRKGNYKWEEKVNAEILKLLQTGYLAELHRKWYSIRAQCDHKDVLSVHRVGNINLQKTAGVFIFFGIGIMLAIIQFTGRILCEKFYWIPSKMINNQH